MSFTVKDIKLGDTVTVMMKVIKLNYKLVNVLQPKEGFEPAIHLSKEISEGGFSDAVISLDDIVSINPSNK